MFYLTTHSKRFIYGYMASDIGLRTILIVRKVTRCHHIGYSFRLTARVLLYASSHRQDSTPRPLLHQSWSTGWNKKYLNGSTMKDRSDDPSHHERTLLPQTYISLPRVAWESTLSFIFEHNKNLAYLLKKKYQLF